MEGKYVIQGGKVMTPEKIHEETDLVISGGKIEGLFPRGSAFPPEYEVIRGEGLYVSPGFVDIHQHGGGGSDYMDDCEDTYYNATWAHIKHGMTSVMPTLVAAGHQGTLRAVEQYVKASESGRICCNLLGLHLEGPYLSPAQQGR